jgi:hypothetical protein
MNSLPSSTPKEKGSPCLATGCKKFEHRFGFCDEHFRQFKFGLITRKGQPVSDYEKKLKQYEEYIKKVR